jgi:hypothetical protein
MGEEGGLGGMEMGWAKLEEYKEMQLQGDTKKIESQTEDR